MNDVAGGCLAEATHGTLPFEGCANCRAFRRICRFRPAQASDFYA
jgi:hypothetical protein